MNRTYRLLIVLGILLVILTAIHWYTTSRPTAYFNQYGNEASSTAIDNIDENAKDDQATTVASSTITSRQTTSPASSQATKNLMHTITIETNKGTIVFETYDADAPNTVKNFITLAEKGFYNNLIFHRVIEGFMIQGGDPTGTGTGGPGYKFADELNASTVSYKTGYVRGTVAMANSGPDTNGSQFFIMHKDYALPHKYTIFGKVISGMDVVDAIAKSPKNSSDKPLTDVVMKKVIVSVKD
jgi:cyclophilin family peptidyl-prolyl cis-trans isomerase